MEKQKLKELVALHKDRFLSLSGLFPRDLQEQARPFLEQGEMLAISGVRRSAKSSLIRLICADFMEHHGVEQPNILYLNLEDERFGGFTSSDFDSLYEAYLELEAPKGRSGSFWTKSRTSRYGRSGSTVCTSSKRQKSSSPAQTPRCSAPK